MSYPITGPDSSDIRRLTMNAADLGYPKGIDIDAAVTRELERAMRHLARAAALCEFGGDQALAGAFYFNARSLAHELGIKEESPRNFGWVAELARRWAENVCEGRESNVEES